tara:strand:- start:4813 stop:5427 length:615 start_codon:yes stop_codon:yes gene_type:complete
MLKKVRLYGDLADFVGHKELDAVINTTADAIRFLITNFEGLEAHMNDRHYKVIANKYELSEDDIHNPVGSNGVSIVPIISGAGGNTGKILLGAMLIGGAFAFGGLAFGGSFKAFGANLAAAPGLTKAAFGIGSALVLSGVSDMLFPLPKFKEFNNEEDPRISFSFSGVQNTSRAGTSIPLCYGEIVTGSVVISAGIDTNQIVAE